MAERNRIRVVYQVHHRTLFPNASSMWPLIKDLPPEHFGVMLDPGNQCVEGAEDLHRSASLLGGHLAALGVKDVVHEQDITRIHCPDKGWSHRFVPCQYGMTNWYAVAAALHAHDFAGTLVFMPFYEAASAEKFRQTMREEVAYVRSCFSRPQAGPG
jgi:sugar phosphate isomerase/epimerase